MAMVVIAALAGWGNLAAATETCPSNDCDTPPATPAAKDPAKTPSKEWLDIEARLKARQAEQAKTAASVPSTRTPVSAKDTAPGNVGKPGKATASKEWLELEKRLLRGQQIGAAEKKESIVARLQTFTSAVAAAGDKSDRDNHAAKIGFIDMRVGKARLTGGNPILFSDFSGRGAATGSLPLAPTIGLTADLAMPRSKRSIWSPTAGK